MKRDTRTMNQQNHAEKPMYKIHEKKLLWLTLGVAAIMLLSIIGRLVSG
ncbi:hypothetical protein [Ornithinibacillus contaminans]|nr:hypothetical protein [Ornithinibacillus contaminans]